MQPHERSQNPQRKENSGEVGTSINETEREVDAEIFLADGCLLSVVSLLELSS